MRRRVRSRSVGAPALRADERNEHHAAEVGLAEASAASRSSRTRRCAPYSPPTGMTSLPPRASCSRSASGTRGPAAATTIASYGAPCGQPTLPSAPCTVDVGEAEPREPFARELDQARMALDRVDVGGEPARHRARVARAGADLEDPVARADPRRLEHQRDDVRLRDRLPLLDRQRRVVVGVAAQRRGDELVARHLAHRREERRIADAARGDLLVDHRPASRGEVVVFVHRRRPRVRPRTLGLAVRLQPGELGRVQVVLVARQAVVLRQRQVAQRRRLLAEPPVGDAEPEMELVVGSRRARPRARTSRARARQSSRCTAAMPRSKKWNGGYVSSAARRLRAASASAGALAGRRSRPGWRGRACPWRRRRGRARSPRSACGEVAVAQVDHAERVVGAGERRVAAQALGGPGVGVVEAAVGERLGGAVVGVHRDHGRFADVARAQAARCLRAAGNRSSSAPRSRGGLGVDQAPADGDVDVAARDQQVAGAAPRSHRGRRCW